MTTVHGILTEMEEHLLKNDTPDPAFLMERVTKAKELLGDWDEIFPPRVVCSASAEDLPDEQPPGQPVNEEKLFGMVTGLSSPKHAVLAWAKQYSQLEGVLEEYLSLSWLLYNKLGFEPTGTTKKWLASLDKMFEASHGDWQAIENGVADALTSKTIGGLTLSGPHSIVSFVASARADIVREETSENGKDKPTRIKVE